MKRLLSILLSIAALLPMCTYAEVPSCVSEKRLTFGYDKDTQIINVAKEICAKHAPEINIRGLTPVIVNFRLYRKSSPLRDGEIVSVKFVKNINDIDQQISFDPREPKTIRVKNSLKAEIHAEVYVDNHEPAGIGVYYGSLFLPDYETFCKENPNYLFKDYSKSGNSQPLESAYTEPINFENIPTANVADNMENRLEKLKKDGYKIIME